MLDLNAILNVLTLVLLGIGGFLLRTATESTVKSSTEAIIKRIDWSAELNRELQKARGLERQELRFKSYGALWKELRPLAIYDAAVISKKAIGDLSSKLSDWYFSEYGGLLLTPHARSFYFALQDLLRTTSGITEEWETDRFVESEGTQKNTFRDVLQARKADNAISVLDYFSKGAFEDWQDRAPDLGKQWRDGINKVVAGWNELDKRQRFATLQQVGSILRTSLVNDLESRLR